MKDELTKYIDMEMKKGFDSYTLKNNLLKNGYSEDDILESFKEIKKKKIIKTILVFLALLVLTGLMLFYYFKHLSFSKAENIKFEYSDKETEVTENAIAKNDVSLCEEAGNLKPYCTGIIKNDPESCRKIEGTISESCMLRIARRTKDASLCSRISGLKDDCYLQLALLTKNRELCKQTKTSEDYCLNVVK